MLKQLFGIRDSSFRRLALHIFRRLNPGDIKIRHHWTSQPMALHSFKHKGYWWHGKKREHKTIERFQRLIKPGDVIIEIGGHIGYFSMLYSQLVGPRGHVFVFEPGENNLPYLRRNLAGKANTRIIEKAVSDQNGVIKFWLEDLSGQNNSMVENYHLLDGNIALAGLGNQVHKKEVTVQSITLDSFIEEMASDKLSPNFVKIDVEGAELMVLKGAQNLLTRRAIPLMVEVTCDAEPIFNMMREHGYSLFLENGAAVSSIKDMNGNIFCLPDRGSITRFNAA